MTDVGHIYVFRNVERTKRRKSYWFGSISWDKAYLQLTHVHFDGRRKQNESFKWLSRIFKFISNDEKVGILHEVPNISLFSLLDMINYLYLIVLSTSKIGAFA